MKISLGLRMNTEPDLTLLQKRYRKGQWLLPNLLLVISIALQATATEYRVLVDDHRRPLPGQPPVGWYYNCMGGDRGLIRDLSDSSGTGVATFNKPSSTTYRGTLQRMIGSSQWEFFGFWQSLGRPSSQKRQWSPAAVFHPLILPKYQGKLIGVDVRVKSIKSPAGRSDLTLKIELKGYDRKGREVTRTYANFVGRAALTQGSFPRVFRLPVDPRSCGKVGLLTVVLDRARKGDSLEVDNITLRVTTPEIPSKLEPLLFSLAMLMDNYDNATHIVQDRANFPNGRFENIPATAKLAKLLALGIKLGLVDRSARNTVDAIAKTLLTRVPRGPAGLWPHFTKKGGALRVSGTEWASGDTAYAALDLLVAMKLIGDPNKRIPSVLSFLRSIRWSTLNRPGQGYSHGYSASGDPLTGHWGGFGMETWGVQLAALVGGGPLVNMSPPPSDTGSGFILHAGYPVVPTGLDRWGNDWSALRRNEVYRQIRWYANAMHSNSFLASRGLFGLSAAERPAGWHSDSNKIYQPYGLGGRISGANDGAHKVVTPHYSGMIAALAPKTASRMWARLRQMGLVSPMNMVESLAMNPRSGRLERVNFLKGSWNLALFAEGWMMAQPGVSQLLEDAVVGIPALNQARSLLMPRRSGTPMRRAYFDEGATGQPIAPERPDVSTEGDFDGDAKADFALYNPAVGSWSLLFSSGNKWHTNLAGSSMVPVPADYDCDGLLDLAVYHPAAGDWYIRHSSTGLLIKKHLGWVTTIPVPGDYDGDGKTDLAVFDQKSGRWYFQCGTTGAYSAPWGYSGWVPVPADYDGDGRRDLAVYNPVAGDWYVLYSSTGLSTNWHLGWASTDPVPADYDGDGKADPAVFHRSSGDWHILRSSDGSTHITHSGWATTIPAPADYDGDRLTDLAVYSTYSGSWYILRSTTGLVTTHEFGETGDLPAMQWSMIHSWLGQP